MRLRDRLAERAGLLRLLGTVVGLGLLVYLLSQQGWQEILYSVRRISLGTFLLVLGLATLSRMAITGRWWALIRGARLDISFSRILRIAYAGFFASNFLPTSIGGDIVRLGGVVDLDSGRADYVSSIAIDRVIGALGMAMLLPLGVAQGIARSGVQVLGGIQPLRPFVLAVALAVGTRRLRDTVVRAYRRVVQALRPWAARPKALLTALGFTWIHMLIRFTSIWILFAALGEEIAYWQIAGLWSFVYFITLFPISINGIGIQEVSAGLVFSELAGVTVSSALTVALLIRTADLLASLPGALSLSGMLARGKAQVPAEPDDVTA